MTDKEAFKSVKKTWNGKDEVGVYNHWQTSFLCDDDLEVEKMATDLGLKFSWGPNRYLKTKRYTSAFEFDPRVKKNVLFSSIADDSIWFDEWPGVKELPTQDQFESADQTMRPLKLTFGDDSDFTREELWQFMHVYDQGGMPIKWKVGDVCVVDNWKWAHGRPAYTLEEGEKRNLGVLLGGLFDRLGQVDGPGHW